MASAKDEKEIASANTALPEIEESATAFSHIPEHGFSLFLAKRTKTIHFVRHAEGTHNQVNRMAGSDLPVTYSTDGSWRHMDARLTAHGIQQCVTVRKTLLRDVNPQLIVVSPFTRTLQTAHILFGGDRIPFVVHDGCRERSGKFTCDKRRPKTHIVQDMQPVYDYTQDTIDFDSFGYPTEEDENWSPEREADEHVTQRAIAFVQWLATRPEQDIAVVTHSSWLKHLFRAFGEQVTRKDQQNLHRLAGNAEVRSVCLAMHRGFYPEGRWEPAWKEGEEDVFIPHDRSFRRFRWAPTHEHVAQLHKDLCPLSLDEPS